MHFFSAVHFGENQILEFHCNSCKVGQISQEILSTLTFGLSLCISNYVYWFFSIDPKSRILYHQMSLNAGLGIWTGREVLQWLCLLWQYGLWSFQAGGTKLESCLHKNQHTQKKLLNLEFWIYGKLSKIGHHFSVNNKKCAPKLVFFNEKKKEKKRFG